MRTSLLVPCLCALILCALPACRSSKPNPERHYTKVLTELRREGGTQALREKGRQRLEELYLEAEEWAQSGKVLDPTGRMWLAACLVQAESPERIEMANQLAVQAALGGDERAEAIIAQAQDKQAVQQGRPQPFGTQYIFDTQRGLWELYPVDPSTTDAQRTKVGVPPLSEVRALLQRMNEEQRDERLKEAEQTQPGRVR